MQVTSSLSTLLGASASPDSLTAPPAPAPGVDFASLLRQNQPAPPAPAPAPMRASTPAPTPAPAPQQALQAPPPSPPAAPAPAPQQSDASSPSPAPAPSPATSNSAPTPPASNTASRSAGKGKAANASQAQASAADDVAEPASAAKPAAPDQTEKTDKPGADHPADATAAASTDPALAAWLAQLHTLAAANAAPAPASGVATDPGTVEGDATAAAAQTAGVADAKAATADTTTDPATTLASTDSGTNPVAFASVLADAGPSDRAADTRKTEGVSATSLPAGMAAALATPATAPGSHASTAVPVAVSTPVDAPDFPQALGVHLSVLAKEGVQHAELHLNPADMGPVSVQIAVDGNQARIDFGADVAATRHAIEAGLPELASALREAGLTLTGGGVSQHSSGQGDGRGGDSNSRGTRGVAGAGDDGGTAPTASARRTVKLGGVDLYA